MNMMLGRTRHGGFTLIETIAVILIVGLLAGVVGPLMVGAAGAYAGARDGRAAIENASFAMDRIVRVLREAPEGATEGTAAFAKALPGVFGFTDGSFVSKSGTDVVMVEPGGATSHPLARDVTAFELTYLRDDGLELDTGAGDDVSDIRRVEIRLVAGGQELRTGVFLRVGMGGGG